MLCHADILYVCYQKKNPDVERHLASIFIAALRHWYVHALDEVVPNLQYCIHEFTIGHTFFILGELTTYDIVDLIQTNDFEWCSIR